MTINDWPFIADESQCWFPQKEDQVNWQRLLTDQQRRTFEQLTAYDRDPRVMRKVMDGLAEDMGIDLVDDTEELHLDANGWDI